MSSVVHQLRRHVALGALTVGVLAAACSQNDGRTLRSPDPGVTAPARSTTSTGDSGTAFTAGSTPGLDLVISSSSFATGEEIPIDFTCRGAGTSPAVAWSGVPPEAVEVVLTVTDKNANEQVHWMVADLPADGGSLVEDAIPPGIELPNFEGGVGWAPLCPPPGETHSYDFTIWAMASPTGITRDMTLEEATDRLRNTEGWRSVLTTTATGT